MWLWEETHVPKVVSSNSRHHILDGHFLHTYLFENLKWVFENTKINEEEAVVGPFFKKSLSPLLPDLNGEKFRFSSLNGPCHAGCKSWQIWINRFGDLEDGYQAFRVPCGNHEVDGFDQGHFRDGGFAVRAPHASQLPGLTIIP